MEEIKNKMTQNFSNGSRKKMIITILTKNTFFANLCCEKKILKNYELEKYKIYKCFVEYSLRLKIMLKVKSHYVMVYKY